jgi:protein involved in polysaccharide export with SLBB domain
MSMLSAKAKARALCLAALFFVAYLACMPMAKAADDRAYKLGSGDQLRVTVFGEKELSGKYDVNGQGAVALPLIGQVQVAGKTIPQAETLIEEKYGTNYLVNPRVSVEVLNYRPFFILGEVNHPGSYPYISDMTVLNAVALAGGFTARADEDDIDITPGNDPSSKPRHVKEDAPVLPGDVVRVHQKFF